MPVVHILQEEAASAESLQALVRSEGHAAVCHASASDLLATVESAGPGCLVFDLAMGELGGIELQRKLRLAGITAPVIMLTKDADVASVVKAMQGGAFEVIGRPFSNAAVLDAVRRAIEADIRHRLDRERQARVLAKLRMLTGREAEVLACLLQGMTCRQTGEELGLSPKTVEVHRTSIMRKLGAKNAIDAARMVFQAVCARSLPTSAGRGDTEGCPAMRPPAEWLDSV